MTDAAQLLREMRETLATLEHGESLIPEWWIERIDAHLSNAGTQPQVHDDVGSLETAGQAVTPAPTTDTPETDEWERRYGRARHWTEFARNLERRRNLQTLIDGASSELPPQARRFEYAGSGVGAFRDDGKLVFTSEYDALREAATLAIAKQRARAEAAEQDRITMGELRHAECMRANNAERQLAAARADAFAECAKLCTAIGEEYFVGGEYVKVTAATMCIQAIERAAKQTRVK